VAGNATVVGTLGVTGLATLASSTLTANPTLSAGTANGVTYLNGGKQVTSGSAFTFDGTTVGINTTIGNSTSLSITGDYTSNNVATFIGVQRTGGAVAGAWSYSDLLGSIQFGTTTNHSLVFLQNNAEAMRLTSTGLGIGTSSLVSKLTVLGAGTINAPETTTTGGSIQTASYGITTRTGNLELGATDALAANIGGSLSFSARYSGTNATWVTGKIGAYRDTATSGVASSYLAFATTTGAGDLTERLRLDSSGNLGLGVTPSASWGSYKVIQLGEQGVLSGYATGAGVLNIGANFYWDGSGYKYLTTNPATLYQQNAGAHNWRVAASGTAGNAISFTQAMTLGADGLLQVGTTTGSIGDGKLQVSATGTGAGAANTVVGLNVFEETSGNKAGLWFGAMTNSNVGVIGSRTASGSIAFQTFNGGWGERARITSGGDLYVGTTTGTLGTGNFGAIISQTGGIFASRNEGAGVAVFYSGGNAGYAQILGNGNLQNSNGVYAAISDVKLKENIVDASPKLADLMQVKVRNYNLIGDTTKQIGVVAQELETVFPAMVSETTDKDAEGNDLGTTTKAVKYSVFVPMLIKAMQEQQAIIESLKARLDAANL
jgi:hypothetical protein